MILKAVANVLISIVMCHIREKIAREVKHSREGLFSPLTQWQKLLQRTMKMSTSKLDST